MTSSPHPLHLILSAGTRIVTRGEATVIGGGGNIVHKRDTFVIRKLEARATWLWQRKLARVARLPGCGQGMLGMIDPLANRRAGDLPLLVDVQYPLQAERATDDILDETLERFVLACSDANAVRKNARVST